MDRGQKGEINFSMQRLAHPKILRKALKRSAPREEAGEAHLEVSDLPLSSRFAKSIPTQIRQLILYTSNTKE